MVSRLRANYCVRLGYWNLVVVASLLDKQRRKSSLCELPFKEIIQEDDTLGEGGPLQVVQEGQKCQNKITKFMPPIRNKTSEAPTGYWNRASSRSRLPFTKGPRYPNQCLRWHRLIMMISRSAKLSYNLTNPGSAAITTIKAVLAADRLSKCCLIPSTTPPLT